MADEGAASYESGNREVMFIYIYPQDLYQAEADLLGKNLYNPITGNLDRTLPMAHPIKEWLYCNEISSIKGYIPTTKGVFPQAISGVVTTVPQFYMLALSFRQPKYRMLSDDRLDAIYGQPRQEWQRYLEGWPRPRTDWLIQEKRNAIYTESGAPGADSIDPDGVHGQPGPVLANLAAQPPVNPTPIPVPWPIALKKEEINYIWKRVPRVGLLSMSGTGRAVNLNAALQKVNLFDFLDYKAGTLKLEGYDLRPLESPLAPELNAGNPLLLEGAPNLCFDVLLSFSFFDPPYDTTASFFPGGNNNPTRGHNLFPWRGKTSGDQTGNNLWYRGSAYNPNNPPTYEGSLAFPSVDFGATIFQLTS